jgi:hypothetical protein
VILVGAVIVVAGFIIGAPREGIVMTTTVIGSTVWCYGCFRWAQSARPIPLIVLGIILCAALPAMIPAVRTIHDWLAFVLLAASVASATGVAFLVAGAVKAISDEREWLTRDLR